MDEGVRIRVAADADMVTARQKGRELALQLGFSTTDATLVATAISEVARNILAYAGEGEIELSTDNQRLEPGIVVIARDRGPGIENLRRAMEDGYSTSRGLGVGLPGARRLMDEFQIVSEPGKGTTVTMKKWRSGVG
ncbi:MAG: anti-sigma regulatory factor [Acidimicrobiia bacterium]